MSRLIDKLAWLHIQDRKLLVARTRYRASFYIPGGKRENGESDQEALMREIREELSVELNPLSIQSAGSFYAKAHGQANDVQVQLSCFYADFEGDIKPRAEIAEVQFIDSQNLVDCSAATLLVLQHLQTQGLIA